MSWKKTSFSWLEVNGGDATDPSVQSPAVPEDQLWHVLACDVTVLPTSVNRKFLSIAIVAPEQSTGARVFNTGAETSGAGGQFAGDANAVRRDFWVPPRCFVNAGTITGLLVGETVRLRMLYYTEDLRV